MELKGKQIGVAITGSLCTYKKLFTELENLVLEGAEVQTIFSNSAQKTDSRFGNAEDFVKRAEEITGKKIMKFEPVQKKDKLNRIVILRSADAEDGEALLRYMKVIAEETPFLIRDPDEEKLTLEHEKSFIQSRKSIRDKT